MSKLSTLTFAFACYVTAAFSPTSSAFASGLDFSLFNDTGYDIRAVFVDPNSSSHWTDDIMGPDILPDGTAVDITFAEGQDTCIWDLKVEWTGDYEPTIWTNLNLCDISKVTLDYDPDTNETNAYTE